MKVRIAVFLDSLEHVEIDNGLKFVLLFDVDRDIIIAAGRQIMAIYNLSYLITWLIGKRVEEVYINNRDEKLKAKIEKSGIRVYPLNKIKDNPLLESLKLPLD